MDIEYIDENDKPARLSPEVLAILRPHLESALHAGFEKIAAAKLDPDPTNQNKSGSIIIKL